MTHDLEQRLRAAKESLPTPTASATTSAWQTLRREVGEGSALGVPERSRSRWRRISYVLAALVALGAAFGLGVWVAPSRGNAAVEPHAEAPGFLPAPGWDTQQTGITQPPLAPGAIASTVPILPADNVGGPPGATFPLKTIASLTGDGVLIDAIFYTAGELAGVDAQFPPRSLPLSVGDATIQPRWEGQPSANVPEYVILAQINGYDVQIDVLFAQLQPTQAALASAQDELNRLVIPQRTTPLPP